MCNRKLNKKMNRRRRGAVIATLVAMLCLVVMMCSMNALAFVDDQNNPDMPEGLNGIETNANAIEGENTDPVTNPVITGIRTYNNTTKNTHTIRVIENGVTYTITYEVRNTTVLSEEISGMDSDQALEYIANKSMTFYTERNVTTIPDIVYGRDYFVRINGLTHITPETLLGSYKLEIANNIEFNNAATTTVTIGNNNDNGNGANANVDNTNNTNSNVNNTGVSAVRSTTRRLSGSVRSIGRASLGSRVGQGNAASDSGADASNSVSAASNSDSVSSSNDNSPQASEGGAGAGSSSNRAVETAANTLTAGAGAGSFWLIILIISDVKLLLWYKNLKEAKKKSTV